MIGELSENPAGWIEPEKPEGGFPARSDAIPMKGSITVKLRDGKPDFEGMRAGTRKNLESVIATEEFQKEFHLAPKLDTEFVDPAFVDQMLNMVASSQALMFAWRYKVPYPLALQVCQYNPQEQAMLRKPAQRVIAKYMPTLYSKWGDEITLGGIMVNLTLAKARAMGEVAKAYHEKMDGAAHAVKPNGSGQVIEPEPVPLEG